jgi:hypothetical protein
LKAVDAPKGMVFNLKWDNGDQIRIREDRDYVKWLIEKLELGLVYIDSLFDNLGLRTNSNLQKEVREDLSPLTYISEDSKCTVLSTLHPNRHANTFENWLPNSIAFQGVARCILGLCRHPADPETRVLVVARNNYGDEGHGMQFNIASQAVKVKSLRSGLWVTKKIGVVVNREPSSILIDDLIGGKRAGRQSILDELLMDSAITNGGMPAKEIIAAAKVAGFGESMVRRRKNVLGIQHRKEGDAWVWWAEKPSPPVEEEDDEYDERDD